jgi:hypothetical protein
MEHEGVLTPVGRAVAQLGIEHTASYSPQARGRSERDLRTGGTASDQHHAWKAIRRLHGHFLLGRGHSPVGCRNVNIAQQRSLSRRREYRRLTGTSYDSAKTFCEGAEAFPDAVHFLPAAWSRRAFECDQIGSRAVCFREKPADRHSVGSQTAQEKT